MGPQVFALVYLAFPVVIAIHNWDEWSTLDRSQGTVGNPVVRFRINGQLFRTAMIVVTTGAALLAVATYQWPSRLILRIAEATVFALFFNALVHGVVSVMKRAATPGIRSALLVVLPYTLFVISLIAQGLQGSWRELAAIAITGLVTLPVAIGISLGIARLLLIFREQN